MENLSVKLDSSQEASVFSFNFPKVSIFILKSSIFMECELLDNETTNSKKKNNNSLTMSQNVEVIRQKVNKVCKN